MDGTILGLIEFLAEANNFGDGEDAGDGAFSHPLLLLGGAQSVCHLD